VDTMIHAAVGSVCSGFIQYRTTLQTCLVFGSGLVQMCKSKIFSH